MTIAINSGSTTRQTGSSVSSFTMAVDVGSSGTWRLLVVAIIERSSTLQAISSVTWNSVALTQAVSVDETSTATLLRASIWYLATQSTGSQTLSVTFGGTVSQYECQAAVFTAGAQPELDDFGSDVSASGSSPSVTLDPTVDGEMLFGAVIHEVISALTTGADETALYNQDNGSWVVSSSYAIQTTATSQAVNWSASNSQNYAAVAASFKESSTATNLTVADATDAHSTDAIALTQAHILALADAGHDHSADVVALAQAHVLAIADALHDHTADSPALTQEHVLAVAGADHAHIAEGVILSLSDILAVANAGHGHTADGLALSQGHFLAVAGALHDHAVDALALIQSHLLAVTNASHAHTADGISFAAAMASRRMFTPAAELRRFTPAVESRLFAPGAETRVHTPAAE